MNRPPEITTTTPGEGPALTAPLNEITTTTSGEGPALAVPLHTLHT